MGPANAIACDQASACAMAVIAAARSGEGPAAKRDADQKTIGKALRLPDSKTGAKVVHLGHPALIEPAWAGPNDLRIRDLQHTFASTAVFARQGLPMIGKLLR